MCKSLTPSSKSVSIQIKDNYSFSVYNAPIKNITPFKKVSLKDIHKVIISDKYKTITKLLSNTEDKLEISKIKATKLDYVTFSGEFNKRTLNGLKQHSNLLCIDVDDLQNIAKIKADIIEQLVPSLIFISPSGNGLKIVYKITITDKATHLRYYKAFEQFFKQQFNITIDEKCKDIPRACFLCFDKDAYYNEGAQTLDNSFIDTFYINIENEQQRESVQDYPFIIENLKKWLNNKESFINGNRNNYITQLAGAYNRYGIPYQLAESDLLTYVKSDFKNAEIKSTIKSIYNQTQWHNISSFEINKPYGFETITSQIKEKEATPLLPIDGFPESIQNFVNEYTEVYKTPRDYITASIIFSTAFAIGNKLELKGRYDNIPLLWMAIVGNVSSGKTDPLKTCLNYFQKKDNDAFKDYQIKKSLFKEYEELSKNEKKAEKPIKEPLYFQYLLNDYTPESLYKAHTVNNRGLCIYRDELKGWLDDFGRYSNSGEQSTMLSSFYRQPMQINRASKEPINIPEPTIYVCGGIQPDILKDLAKDSRSENGFLARIIFAYPDLQDKQYYSNMELDNETIINYYNYLDRLANIENHLKLNLSDEANTIYNDWYNKNVDTMNKEPTGYLKGVYGKLDVISLRLAIIIHGMNWACRGETSTEISAQSMQTATELTEYFRTTSLKVYHKIFKDNSSQLNNKAVAKYCAAKGAKQREISQILNISQQAVSKFLIKQ